MHGLALRERRALNGNHRFFEFQAADLQFLIEKTVPIQLNHELFRPRIDPGRSPADPGQREMPPVAL